MTEPKSLRLLAVFVAVVVLSLTGCSESKITKSNYDKINNGMTEAEVHAILGMTPHSPKVEFKNVNTDKKPDLPPLATTTKYWHEGTKSIFIHFQDGKVTGKHQTGVFVFVPGTNVVAEEQWEKTKKALVAATERLETVRWCVAVIASLFFVFTTWRLLLRNDSLCACELPTYCIFWTVVPPIYFFIEYWCLFEESGKMDSAINTIFSNGQQTGRTIWLGVTAFVLFSANAIASRQAKKRSDEQPTAKNAEEPQEKETPQRIQDDKDKKE